MPIALEARSSRTLTDGRGQRKTCDLDPLGHRRDELSKDFGCRPRPVDFLKIRHGHLSADQEVSLGSQATRAMSPYCNCSRWQCNVTAFR